MSRRSRPLREAQMFLITAMQEALESPSGFKIRASSVSQLKNLFYSTRRTFPEYASLRLLATADPSTYIIFKEPSNAQEIRSSVEEADNTP